MYTYLFKVLNGSAFSPINAKCNSVIVLLLKTVALHLYSYPKAFQDQSSHRNQKNLLWINFRLSLKFNRRTDRHKLPISTPQLLEQSG